MSFVNTAGSHSMMGLADSANIQEDTLMLGLKRSCVST